MNIRGVYVFTSVVGPIFVMAGMVGMFGLVIPDPYWLFSLIVGASLILYSQRQAKRLQPANKPIDIPTPALAQKKQRFWILVVTAFAVCATAPFWIPLTTPNTTLFICWMVPLTSFPILVGLFWYLIFKKLP